MPVLKATPVIPVRELARCRPTNAQYRATINDGDITSFEVGGINPHELKMDQQLKLQRLSHGPVIRFCHFVRSGRG